MQEQRIPLGWCQCGCGGRTAPASKTRSCFGHVKGRPLDFINGHNTRTPISWTEEDRGYDTPCWIWNGTLDCYGYGVLRLDYHQQKAHRWAYQIVYGPIPSGLTIDHLCAVLDCVNPSHMEPVTSSENTRRMRARLKEEQACAQ